VASINATKVAAEVYSNYVMAAIPQDLPFHIEIPGGSSKERTEREIVTRVVVTDDQQFLHKTAAFYTEQCTSPLLFQVIS